MKTLLWCNHYYRVEACKEKAKELRATGEYSKVRVVDHMTEMGEKYARIRVWWEEK